MKLSNLLLGGGFAASVAAFAVVSISAPLALGLLAVSLVLLVIERHL